MGLMGLLGLGLDDYRLVFVFYCSRDYLDWSFFCYLLLMMGGGGMDGLWDWDFGRDELYTLLLQQLLRFDF